MADEMCDPLELLPPISTVLQSSDSSSESTFGEAKRRRTVTDEDSLAALLLRFDDLNERYETPDDGVVVRKQRPSKRQRRSLKLKTAGFEGPPSPSKT
mmetsp:Transcript_13638/g.44463  ORF Transcript_13638/g.44463 Transcript_13638/m.44463 type:complete len:98 (+) Transcript_13638:74-367(+)